MADVRRRPDRLTPRRTAVAMLVASGASQREIARQLGVSVGTINKDMKALRAEWAAQRGDAMTFFDETLARLRMMLGAVWSSVMLGDLDSITSALKIIDMMMRLYGFSGARAGAGTDAEPTVQAQTVYQATMVVQPADAQALLRQVLQARASAGSDADDDRDRDMATGAVIEGRFVSLPSLADAGVEAGAGAGVGSARADGARLGTWTEDEDSAA